MCDFFDKMKIGSSSEIRGFWEANDGEIGDCGAKEEIGSWSWGDRDFFWLPKFWI